MNPTALHGEKKIRLGGLIHQDRSAVGFFLRFVLFLAGLFFLLVAVDRHFSPVGFVDLPLINRGIALAGGWVLHLLGAGTAVAGNLILAQGFTFRIDNNCTALDATMIYLSGVLAYPGGMKEKIQGVLVGVAALQLVNLLRIIGLFGIMRWFPDFFGGAHVYAAQVLVIGSAGALWLWWMERLPRPAAS